MHNALAGYSYAARNTQNDVKYSRNEHSARFLGDGFVYSSMLSQMEQISAGCLARQPIALGAPVLGPMCVLCSRSYYQAVCSIADPRKKRVLGKPQLFFTKQFLRFTKTFFEFY